MSAEWGPLLAIRADADNRTGIGHVMRTLAIAQNWICRGGRVVYLSVTMPEVLTARLLAAGIRTVTVEKGDDARSTAEAATRLRCAVLLVDHYGLAGDWWAALPATRRWRTAALNDFKRKIHTQAEILISPRACSLPDDNMMSVSGPSYLLLRSEVLRIAPAKPPGDHARHVLLVLGGADPRNIGPIAATHILSATPAVKVRVIVGPAAANRAEFDAIAQSDTRLEIVERPESMRTHFEWADTAVASPSTTVFEALHHGLVTGLVLTADNQLEVAADLMAQGCAHLLVDARAEQFSWDMSAWTALVHDAQLRADLSVKGVALVDGQGAKRACDVLGLPEVSFRNAAQADARLVWEWANDPIARAASFSSDPIPWEEHLAWFSRRIAQGDPIYLAENGAHTPLAVLRFDRREEGVALISYNLAPFARGKDLATLVLGRACALFRKQAPGVRLHAWIKNNNLASQRCFVRAGFRELPDAAQSDRRLYVQSS